MGIERCVNIKPREQDESADGQYPQLVRTPLDLQWLSTENAVGHDVPSAPLGNMLSDPERIPISRLRKAATANIVEGLSRAVRGLTGRASVSLPCEAC
jgi:hypothetical protein